MTAEKRPAIDRTNPFNRFMYVVFVLLALYFALVQRDLGSAMSNLGIGLIFDPFDHRVMWSKRPIYQRVWLVVHAAGVLGLLITILFS